MEELSETEAVIYNEGERLIPGVSHNHEETVRHRSSYVFWRKIIELDIAARPASAEPISIVDLGSGVGHGCVTLAEIPGTRVVGVDTSAECLQYAEEHYGRPNIEYVQADLAEYIPTMETFDYVVSRGAMEHVPDGLRLVRAASGGSRLMFDVPYDEAPGVNPHHVIFNVREDAFADFADAEIFFQDLAGVTYDVRTKPERPNMIICVSSASGLPSVSGAFRFPMAAWEEEPPRRNWIDSLRRLVSGRRRSS
jgi:SAM-dependent methyltransferase